MQFVTTIKYNLKIGKLMTNIFNRIFRVSLMLVFLYFFRYDFFFKLLEHDKLIANYGLFFENIMQNRTSVFN